MASSSFLARLACGFLVSLACRPAGTGRPLPRTSRPAFPPRRIITVAVIVVLGIVAAVIGHTIAAGSSIGVGDCGW